MGGQDGVGEDVRLSYKAPCLHFFLDKVFNAPKAPTLSAAGVGGDTTGQVVMRSLSIDSSSIPPPSDSGSNSKVSSHGFILSRNDPRRSSQDQLETQERIY